MLDYIDRKKKKVYFYDGDLYCVCCLAHFPPKRRGVTIAVDKTQAFIAEAMKRHDGKYEYGGCVYSGSEKRILVTCRKHGDFSTTPHMHLTDLHGCKWCVVEKQKSTVDEVLSRCRAVHGDRYQYDFSNYTGSVKTSKILITCMDHGVFEQAPYNHYGAKQGCPECGKRTQGGASLSDHLTTSERYGGFSCLYLIKCFNDHEIFYKIGLTTSNVNIRFNPSKLPYRYEVIREVELKAKDTWLSEKSILQNTLSLEYIPEVIFSGYSECRVFCDEVVNVFDSTVYLVK